jgi:tight adherence protein B
VNPVPFVSLLVIGVVALSVGRHGAVRIRLERRLDGIAGLSLAHRRRGSGFRARLAELGAASHGAHRIGRLAAGAAIACATGFALAGIPGAVLGVVASVVADRALGRRRMHKRAEALELQLSELVEASALAVRGGASVAQAVEIAALEVQDPMASIVSAVVAQQRLGEPFDWALDGLAATLGTEDARLYVMVMGIHHRTGGNVAGPLHEVAETIRHRIAVRRELRALTAQGRISGVVLGILPIAFFVVLSATSHRELAPVYRSPAGAAMIVGGLLLEGLAYLWIRRLLRVEG